MAIVEIFIRNHIHMAIVPADEFGSQVRSSLVDGGSQPYPSLISHSMTLHSLWLEGSWNMNMTIDSDWGQGSDKQPLGWLSGHQVWPFFVIESF